MITLRISALPDAPSWCVRLDPSAYDEACRDTCSGMPGLKWVKDTSAPNEAGYYRGDSTAAAIVAEHLKAAKVAHVEWSVSPTLWTATADVPCPHELRAYQREGARWAALRLATTGGALLADEMGLGKSAQSIAAVEASTRGFVQVICPAIVTPHWEGQIKRWARRAGQWLAPISYGKFLSRENKRTKAKEPLPDVSAYVLDEIHYCSNPKAKRTKAVRAALAEHAARPLVLGLSGTPMTAEPGDLWQPLDLLHPGRWGNHWAFQKRYCEGHYEEIKNTDKAVWVAKGSSHVDELARRLQSVMLRRTKAEVARDLPPRTRIVHEIDLPAAARRESAALMAALSIGGTRESAQDVLSRLEVHKIDAACELAKEVLACGGRPLLLTTRKDTAAKIGAELGCPHVTGDVDVSKRRGAIADAQCAAATMYCLTTGIDLTGFTCVIFVGLDWLPSRMLQAEARVHRLGQTADVTVYFLIGRGTFDEHVREVVLDRLDTFAALVGNAGDEGDFSAALGGTEESLIDELLGNLGLVKGKTK